MLVTTTLHSFFFLFSFLTQGKEKKIIFLKLLKEGNYDIDLPYNKPLNLISKLIIGNLEGLFSKYWNFGSTQNLYLFLYTK